MLGFSIYVADEIFNPLEYKLNMPINNVLTFDFGWDDEDEEILIWIEFKINQKEFEKLDNNQKETIMDTLSAIVKNMNIGFYELNEIKIKFV